MNILIIITKRQIVNKEISDKAPHLKQIVASMRKQFDMEQLILKTPLYPMIWCTNLEGCKSQLCIIHSLLLVIFC